MADKKNKDKDLDFEIKFCEDILKENPGFVEVITALGDLYTQKGLYEKGLKIDEKLVRLKPEDPVVLYNLACSYSLVKDLDKAFSTIKKAIRCGYDDFHHLKRDEDLINLRNDERFKRYFSRLKIK